MVMSLFELESVVLLPFGSVIIKLISALQIISPFSSRTAMARRAVSPGE